MARQILIGILTASIVTGPLIVLSVIDDWSVLAFYGIMTLGIIVGLAAMFRVETLRERKH